MCSPLKEVKIYNKNYGFDDHKSPEDYQSQDYERSRKPRDPGSL